MRRNTTCWRTSMLRVWVIVFLGASLCVARGALAEGPDTLSSAQALVASGQAEEAAQLLDGWLQTHPADVEACLYLASIYLKQAPLKAVAVLERTLSTVGDDPSLLTVLVQAEGATGRAGPWVAALKRLREVTPDRPEVMLQLAEAHDRNNDPTESAAALDAYLAVRPNDAQIWSRLADRRERLSHVVDAIRAREALKILQPQDVKNQLRLGELYVRMARDVEAIAAFESALAVDPRSATALRRLAQLYGWNDMPKQRISTLQTLRRVVPDDVDVRRRLAEAYSELERYDLAAAQLDAVLRVEPGDQQSRFAAAQYHSWADNDAAAVQHLEAVVRSEPENGLARQLLANLLRARGDKQEALFHYQQLQARGQADTSVRDAIQTLELDTLTRVSGSYEFYIDRNGQSAHRASTWFERSSSDTWRYRTGYRFSYNDGVSLQRPNQTLDLPGHGGFIGSRFRLAPRSYLDTEIWVTDVENVDPFVGLQVSWVQRAQFPLEFRLDFRRRQDTSTIDALFYDTVVYELNSALQVEPVDRWIVEAEAGYGRWINDSVQDGTRQFNNGFTWRAATGVRILEEPLTLELMADYDGIAFQVFARQLPYFAPEIYQRIGGTLYLNHKPAWWFEYSLYGRPNWVLEDDALQIVYGADVKLFVARRHWMELSFVRTDTALGTTNVVYRENVVRFTWISAF